MIYTYISFRMLLTIWYLALFGFMGFEGQGPVSLTQPLPVESKHNGTSNELDLDWGYGVHDAGVMSDEDMGPSLYGRGPDHGSKGHEEALFGPQKGSLMCIEFQIRTAIKGKSQGACRGPTN